jgi:hypothetical protein
MARSNLAPWYPNLRFRVCSDDGEEDKEVVDDDDEETGDCDGVVVV